METTQLSLFEEFTKSEINLKPSERIGGGLKDRIALGNCVDLLKKIESNSVDLIATDPPYQINFEGNLWDSKSSVDWEIVSLEFDRVLKENGSLIVFQGWSEIVNTMKCLDKFFRLKNWIIYDRIKGRGTKTNLVSTREDILWYIKGDDYTYNKISSTILKKTGGTIGRKNGKFTPQNFKGMKSCDLTTYQFDYNRNHKKGSEICANFFLQRGRGPIQFRAISINQKKARNLLNRFGKLFHKDFPL